MSSNAHCRTSAARAADVRPPEPLILALDTSHERGSVAICRGHEPLCEILFDASDTHSATLMPAVDVCVRSARVSLRDIELLAVVCGPGSFTGLRIALATVKAFSAACGASVVPVSSLEALAAALPYAGRPVLPLIDARRGEVYGALYRTDDGAPRALVEHFAARPDAVAGLLGAAAAEPLILCGTGALRYRTEIAPQLAPGSIFAPERWSTPSASLVALIARGRPGMRADDLASLEPLYLRAPDARLPAGTRLGEGGGNET
jgi:tRNA threonylcarbamoyladenosine biosynthesis protein TsaB